MSRLGIRRRLLLAVLAATVVMVAVLVAAFNMTLTRVLDHDARDLVRSRAAAQLASLSFENGRLTAGEAPDDRSADANIWIFAGNRAIEQPRTASSIDRAATSLSGGPARYLDVPSADTRLYAVPASEGGRRVGTVVAGVSLAPYEEVRQTALVASLVLGLLIVLLVAIVARSLLSRSLRPVVRMTRQAAAWSEHDLDRRFALGSPHDELTELAATLDGLLDRLAASLRRERRFSAELSHELRTPIAHVLAESELALRRTRRPREYRQTLELIHESADQLSRTVDALVTAARYEAGGNRGTADAKEIAERATAACSGLASERGIEFAVEVPDRPPRVGVDLDLGERIAQPVVENACRYGASRVRVTIGREGSIVTFTVEDDGPGVGNGEKERIFEPGVRGAAAGTENGAGLGLALARRLARSSDGDITAHPGSPGGCFVIRLPSA
jgi:signal transduction histidine kinase